MDYITLARSAAAYWLSVMDLCVTPLKVMAQAPPRNDGESLERQAEVWQLWGKQAPPVQEVIFR